MTSSIQEPSQEVRHALKASLKQRKGSRAIRIIGPFTPLALLVIWEFASRFGWVDARFFPAPSSIFSTFVELLQSGVLMDHTVISLVRILVGFTLGAIPGVLVGVLLGSLEWARILFEPIFASMLPIPKITIYPLLMLIFGLGETSKWLIIAIGVFFTVMFNTLGGVLQTNLLLFDVAKANGANPWQQWAGVALPSALPSVFTGLKLALGGSFVVLAASEYVGSQSGLGYMIWSAWSTFSVSKMYVGIVVISVLGYCATSLVSLAQRLLVPWTRR
ncbi:ABC transporter permease [Bifidobacterium psychraerophilum]|uniref:ABC transporter permease n=1 Tax=Bifidobacterium psychraerophilum TaxID=218140 RepID=UPI0039EBB64A